MEKFRSAVAVTLIMLLYCAMCFITGCGGGGAKTKSDASPTPTASPSAPSAGRGVYQFHIAWPPKSRSVLDSANSVRIRITQTGQSEKSGVINRPDESVTFPELQPGAAVVTAEAFTELSAGGNKIGEGSKDTTIVAGRVIEESITLSPVNAPAPTTGGIIVYLDDDSGGEETPEPSTPILTPTPTLPPTPRPSPIGTTLQLWDEKGQGQYAPGKTVKLIAQLTNNIGDDPISGVYIEFRRKRLDGSYEFLKRVKTAGTGKASLSYRMPSDVNTVEIEATFDGSVRYAVSRTSMWLIVGN